MNTKNLLKATVASFLLFGLSAISAKAMEPEDHEKRRAQGAITANIPELDPDYAEWRALRTITANIMELDEENEALEYAKWKEEQWLMYYASSMQLAEALAEPLKNSIQKWKELLAILKEDPTREDIYIPYAKASMDACKLGETFIFEGACAIRGHGLYTEISDLYSKISTEALELPEDLQAKLDVLSEPFCYR